MKTKQLEKKIEKLVKGKKKKTKCTACGGIGNVDRAVGFELDCAVCDGTGWVEK